MNINNSNSVRHNFNAVSDEKNDINKSNMADQCSHFHALLVPEFVEHTKDNIIKRINELTHIINKNQDIINSNHKFQVHPNFVDDAMKEIAPEIANGTKVSVTICKKIPKTKHEYKKIARNRLNRKKPKFLGNYVFGPLIFDNLFKFIGSVFGTNNGNILIFIDVLQKILHPSSVVQFEQTRAQPLVPYNTFVMENKFKLSCLVMLKHYSLDSEWIHYEDKDGKKKKMNAKTIWNNFRNCLNKINYKRVMYVKYPSTLLYDNITAPYYVVSTSILPTTTAADNINNISSNYIDNYGDNDNYNNNYNTDTNHNISPITNNMNESILEHNMNGFQCNNNCIDCNNNNINCDKNIEYIGNIDYSQNVVNNPPLYAINNNFITNNNQYNNNNNNGLPKPAVPAKINNHQYTNKRLANSLPPPSPPYYQHNYASSKSSVISCSTIPSLISGLSNELPCNIMDNNNDNYYYYDNNYNNNNINNNAFNDNNYDYNYSSHYNTNINANSNNNNITSYNDYDITMQPNIPNIPNAIEDELDAFDDIVMNNPFKIN